MKKLVVLFISLMFMVSLCMGAAPTIVFADNVQEQETQDNKLTYAALGDSMSQGYMFAGYKDENSGWQNVVKGTYIDKFAKDIKANLIDLTAHGLQPDELCALLYEDKTIFEKTATAQSKYSSWTDGNPFSSFEEMSKYFIDAIKAADVITYDIGINYFGTFLTDFAPIYDTFYNLLLDSKCKEQIKNICTVIEQELNKLDIGIDIPITGQDGIINRILYGCVSYMVYGDKCIAKIKELNPTAQIILIPLSNPQRELYLDLNGTKIGFSDILDIVFESLNNYFRYISINRKLYTIAELSSPMISFGDELYFYPDNPSDDFKENLYKMITGILGNELTESQETEYLEIFKKAATYRTFTVDIVKQFLGGLLGGDETVQKALFADLIRILNTPIDSLEDEDFIKLNLILHFGELGGARGFQTHPCPSGLAMKYDAIKKVYKPIDYDECLKEAESELNEGIYTLCMNKKNAGEFTFTKADSKWTIQNSNDKYLSVSQSSLVESDIPFEWDYNNGYFSAKEDKTIGTLPINITYYLSFKDDKLAVTVFRYKATKASFIKKEEIHTHEIVTVTKNEIKPTCITKGYYDTVSYCEDCGKELTCVHHIVGIDTKTHKPGNEKVEIIDGNKYRVTRCLYCKEILTKNVFDEKQEFDVSVTVKEITSKLWLFLTKKTYDIKISVSPKESYFKATKVEFSFDQIDWKCGKL